MNSDSDPVLISKRLRTEIKTIGENPVTATDDLAGPASGGSTVVVTSEDVFDSAVNVFTDDILPVIFQNTKILTLGDLLNFRGVNRCWRDAATLVILKQNLSHIALDFGKVSIGEDGDEVAETGEINMRHYKKNPASYKFFESYNPKSFLSDLTSLISASPKFPSTRIHFSAECNSAFGNLCPPASHSVHAAEHQIDLFNFLSLHGTKFKKLSLCDGISKKAIQNLLYVHMPHLTNLDLSALSELSAQDVTLAGRKIPLCLPPPSTLAIQEISVAYLAYDYYYWKFDVMKELVRNSPNLSVINNVHTCSLGFLHEMGKFQLIEELHFELSVHEMSTRDQLSKILAATILKRNVSHIKLSKLSVGFLDLPVDYENYNDKITIALKVLNIILSASKNYLKYLTIHMKPSDFLVHLFIPRLPHLKFLELHDDTGRPINIKMNFLGDVIGGALETGGITTNESTHEFCRLSLHSQSHNINIPLDYFPRLQQVNLHMQKMKKRSDKLMNFFALEHPRRGLHEETTFLADTLPAVTKLQLDNCTVSGLVYRRQWSRLFPNVSHLEICCEYSDSLSNSFWTAFPKLETFNIFGLGQGQDSETNVIDSFFTGISPKACSKLESTATRTALKSRRRRNFKRTMPYIGDCKNLKEFKIQFKGKLDSLFASEVTALHGFQKVNHQTKIIFCFNSHNWSVEEREETRRHLDPVSQFVEIDMPDETDE